VGDKEAVDRIATAATDIKNSDRRLEELCKPLEVFLVLELSRSAAQRLAA
jgi:hypothetical protein